MKRNIDETLCSEIPLERTKCNWILLFGWKRWENKEQRDNFLKYRKAQLVSWFRLSALRVVGFCYFCFRLFARPFTNGFRDKEFNLSSVTLFHIEMLILKLNIPFVNLFESLFIFAAQRQRNRKRLVHHQHKQVRNNGLVHRAWKMTVWT